MRPAVALSALLLAASGAAAKSPAPAWRLVFSSARTGIAQIYSVLPSGHGLAQLTFGALDACNPVPSPDGRHILYSVGCHSLQLRLATADGRRDSASVAGGKVAWSGDSRRFAFVDPNGRLGVATLSGATSFLRPTGETAQSPAWSADGRLAFVRTSWTEQSAELVVQGKVLATATSIGRIAWSADGRRLAYTFARTDVHGVGLIGVSGAPRNLFVAQGPGPPAPTLSWAPDGKHVAFTELGDLEVSDTSGIVRKLATLGATSVAWSPRGDAIAVTDGGQIALVSLDGQVRTVFRSPQDDALLSVAWQRVPAGARLRTPEPALKLVEASGDELRSRYPIPVLTANGGEVAYRTCGFAFGTWSPGSPLVPPAATACRDAIGRKGFPVELGLARDRVGVLYRDGGNGVFWDLDVVADGVARVVEAGGMCCAGDTTLPPVGYLLGGGDTLVYSTWTRCFFCAGGDFGGSTGAARVAAQTIFRLDPPAMPVQIASASGAYEPFALDGSRLVVRRQLTGIDVLDASGRPLLSWELGARLLGAELAGNDLVVLIPGELRDYDAASGNLLRRWALPEAQSGGYCGRVFCANPDVLLAGAAPGLVAYTLSGGVHLFDLRTGADRRIADAVAARLTSAGLFYSYVGAAPWPGRIRFVPLAGLR